MQLPYYAPLIVDSWPLQLHSRTSPCKSWPYDVWYISVPNPAHPSTESIHSEHRANVGWRQSWYMPPKLMLSIDSAIGVLQVTIYNARGLKNPDKFSGTP